MLLLAPARPLVVESTALRRLRRAGGSTHFGLDQGRLETQPELLERRVAVLRLRAEPTR